MARVLAGYRPLTAVAGGALILAGLAVTMGETLRSSTASALSALE